jgi:hypothetical protein
VIIAAVWKRFFISFHEDDSIMKDIFILSEAYDLLGITQKNGSQGRL